MKINLSMVAIVLAGIAVVISLSQPVYHFLVNVNRSDEGKPSFNVYDFYVFHTFTRLYIRNNGTVTAHNVGINLVFTGFALSNWEATQFIPETREGFAVMLEFPIGQYQLESTVPEGQWFTNASDYKAVVHIICNELVVPRTFHFQDFIP